MDQLDIFSLMYPKYKINKPIKLIELFAGIGSQAKALKRLGANFEHYKVVEFDKYAIASYNAVHGTNFATSDITKINAEDLEIVDTNKYCYIMTYSFPCQDLSLAGKGKGMKKGAKTRSGLLWEVERILDECNNLPQILLMENVPQVHSEQNMNDFIDWQNKLESLGYQNYWQDLNAKDYGIPQNRNRCFMVSILGDYCYNFPKPFELKLRLKDMLEDEVDEKYYLSDKMIQGMTKTNFESYKLENKLLDVDGIANTIIARFEGTPQCIQIKENTKKGYAEATEGDGVYINRPHQKRGCVQKDIIQTIKTQPHDVGVVVKDTRNMKEILCDKLIESGVVKENDVINHSYTNGLTGKNPNSRQTLEDYIETKDNTSPCLTTRPDTLGVVVVGNYSPSGHNASRVVDPNGLAPTVMENHGTVTATVVKKGKTNEIEINKEKFEKGGVCGYDYSTNREQEQRCWSENGNSPTITASNTEILKVVCEEYSNLRIRKLTPKECWRLMGFDDENFDKAAKVNSNAQLYKQAGNSIVVNVLECIFKELLEG